MKRKHVWIGAAGLGVAVTAAWFAIQPLLQDAFARGPSEGPFMADGVCPAFRPVYGRCEVRFGNRGLSTLNSFYETFVRQGSFEIDGFEVESLPEARFNITARSNRGPIMSRIQTDRLVRLGQDRENETVHRTHQSAYCDAGRIYEHQVGYVRGRLNVQELEFWTESDMLRFRLFQNGAPTADVVCRP